MKTIRANKNLHYLTDRLPKSNYQNGHEYEKVPKLNQSAKGKNEIRTSGHYQYGSSSKHNSNNNVNLPKLDRILVKGSQPKNIGLGGIHGHQERERQHPLIQKKASKVDINEMLKI